MQREFGVEFRWTVFPLHTDTPQEGIELSTLLAVPQEQVRAMQAKLIQMAAAEGLPIAERSRTYNSRRAQELGKWAQEKGKGDAFRHAVYRAFFVAGRNIALVDELSAIAEEAGLSALEARSVLETGSYGPAVDADWERSSQLGITAVPTHICEGRRIVGFTGYDAFVRLMGKANPSG